MAITLDTRDWRLEARKKRGVALLIAVIFMSVMLAFGLALGSLSYKQQVLASYATQSQYAFYAADAALECALYYDQQTQSFNIPTSDPVSPPNITCNGGSVYVSSEISWSPSLWVITYRFDLDSNRCADVTFYKRPPNTGTNYIFAQGYDVPCTIVANPNGARFATRGLEVYY